MSNLIYLMVNNEKVKVDTLQFSDGALRISVDHEHMMALLDDSKINTIRYVVTPQQNVNDVIMTMHLTHSTVKRHVQMLQAVEHILHFTYLPYARADRKFSEGEPDSPLEQFMELLPDFDRIVVDDPHNEQALLDAGGWDDLEIISQENILRMVIQSTPRLRELKDFVLIAPDKGSVKKINNVLEMFQQSKVFPTVVLADKIRDPETGNITKLSLPPVDLSGQTCLIVDDIVDGGGTFIGLAKLLKQNHNADTVILYATHGIFSKGLAPFITWIDEIYCNHIVGDTSVSMESLKNFN